MDRHLKWLAHELGCELVTAPGVRSDSGLQSLDGRSLEVEAAGRLDIAADDARLGELCDRARGGEAASALFPGAGDGGGTRVLALPAGEDQAALLLAPTAHIPELSRRAALADLPAAVSHEVANALGAIGGWADLALRSDSGVDPRHALELISRCVRTAQGAARHLLALAKGQPSDEHSWTDASALTEEVGELLTVSAKQARVHLSRHVDPAVAVPGHSAELFSVVWNLTKNAIEACPAGGQVELSLRASDDQVRLEVCDNGPGMSAESRARIFSPYYSTKSTGTGLGLPLVQDTARRLGGDVEVDSQPGQGTRFVVRLPRLSRSLSGCLPQKPERAALTSAEHETQPLAGARVLVVDDDAALRELICTALSLKGAQVEIAESAAQARLVPGRFDVALIDMLLADGRGDELLSDLRQRGAVNAAMLVTGSVQRPKLVPGGEPDDWVRKPFELSLLVDRLKRTLERHRMLNMAGAAIRL